MPTIKQEEAVEQEHYRVHRRRSIDYNKPPHTYATNESSIRTKQEPVDFVSPPIDPRPPLSSGYQSQVHIKHEFPPQSPRTLQHRARSASPKHDPSTRRRSPLQAMQPLQPRTLRPQRMTRSHDTIPYERYRSSERETIRQQIVRLISVDNSLDSAKRCALLAILNEGANTNPDVQSVKDALEYVHPARRDLIALEYKRSIRKTSLHSLEKEAVLEAPAPSPLASVSADPLSTPNLANPPDLSQVFQNAHASRDTFAQLNKKLRKRARKTARALGKSETKTKTRKALDIAALDPKRYDHVLRTVNVKKPVMKSVGKRNYQSKKENVILTAERQVFPTKMWKTHMAEKELFPAWKGTSKPVATMSNKDDLSTWRCVVNKATDSNILRLLDGIRRL